jgi:hypothetical protein
LGLVHPAIKGADCRLVNLRFDFGHKVLAQSGDLSLGFSHLPTETAANGSAMGHTHKAQGLT